jgi:hypothetical protein
MVVPLLVQLFKIRNEFAGISIDPSLRLVGNDAVQRAGLTIYQEGKLALSQYNYITSKESYVSFVPPISNTNLQFPSKSISGTCY